MSTEADRVNERFSKVCTDLEMALRQWIQLWVLTDKYGVQHHHMRQKVRSEAELLTVRVSQAVDDIEKSGMKNALRAQAIRLKETQTVLSILSRRINNTGVDQRFTHESGGHSESGYRHTTSAGLPTLGKR